MICFVRSYLHLSFILVVFLLVCRLSRVYRLVSTRSTTGIAILNFLLDQADVTSPPMYQYGVVTEDMVTMITPVSRSVCVCVCLSSINYVCL